MLLVGREPQLVSIFIARRRDNVTWAISQRQNIHGDVQRLSSRRDKKGLERNRSFLSAAPWSAAEISYLQGQAGVTPLNPEDAGGGSPHQLQKISVKYTLAAETVTYHLFQIADHASTWRIFLILCLFSGPTMHKGAHFSAGVNCSKFYCLALQIGFSPLVYFNFIYEVSVYFRVTACFRILAQTC